MVYPANLTTSPRSKESAFLAGDPRFLMAGFALIALAAFVITDTRGLLVVLVYVLALHRLAGIPSRSLVKAARSVALFVVLVVAINAVLVEGRPLNPSIPFVSREGIASGIHASVRVLVLYFGMVVFLAVASAEDMAKGISALVAPISKDLARRAAMYGFLSFGFLPLFADETRRITVAQKFRGGGLEGGLFKKLKGVRLLIVPLVLSAIHRSAELAMIVELRRIRSTIDGILVLEKTSQKDYVYLVTTVVVLTAAWITF
jgi:energy-coupling factor transporter transmembrane protein EcfT